MVVMGANLRLACRHGKLEIPAVSPGLRSEWARTMSGELSGREAETRSIDDFLARAAAAPAMLVLSGEPGIGKTALWHAGLERARARGARVLSHRAVEAEAVLSFAGISELLAGVLGEVLPSLGDLRRCALEAALLLEGAGDRAAPEPRAVGLAVLDSLRALSGEAPVLVAVDDFQWLDTASARTLLFALRRLGGEPIGALVTARSRARARARAHVRGRGAPGGRAAWRGAAVRHPQGAPGAGAPPAAADPAVRDDRRQSVLRTRHRTGARTGAARPRPAAAHPRQRPRGGRRAAGQAARRQPGGAPARRGPVATDDRSADRRARRRRARPRRARTGRRGEGRGARRGAGSLHPSDAGLGLLRGGAAVAAPRYALAPGRRGRRRRGTCAAPGAGRRRRRRGRRCRAG